MSKPVIFLVGLLVLALPAVGQGGKGPPSSRYENEELGLSFAGVYGWQARFVTGSGAWTDLASYEESALDASVRLQMRDNPHETLADLRAAVEKEFAAAGEPRPGQPSYKEVTFSEVQTKGPQKLPGIQAEGYALLIDEEGKKREHLVVVRTVFGSNRLFRVSCSVRRNRAKRVRDLFDHALDSLKVEAQAERVAEEIGFKSQRGGYTCKIPRGFGVVLPEAEAKHDVFFDGGRQGISISVFCLEFKGELFDLRDDLEYEFGEDLTFDKEEAEILGGTGLLATVKRGNWVTLIAGVLRDGRVVQVRTDIKSRKLDAGRQIHEAFLADFKFTR